MHFAFCRFQVIVSFCLACIVADHANAQLARIRLDTIGNNGQPISKIEAGQEFLLRAYAEDLRDDPQGVFAAYIDVAFDQTLVAPGGEFSYFDEYPNGLSGEIASGEFIGAGAFDGIDPIGAGEFAFFEIRMTAQATGAATFTPEFAENSLREILLYGIDTGIPEVDLSFVSASINIVPEPSTISLAAMGVVFLVGQTRRFRSSS